MIGMGEYISDLALYTLPLTLTELDISGFFNDSMKYTDEGVKHLNRLQSLRMLNVSYCKLLTVAGLFTGALHIESLRELIFDGDNILMRNVGKGRRKQGAEKIEINVAKTFPNLTYLSLCYKKSIGTKEEHLRELPSTLCRLQLDETNISPQMLKYIPATVNTIILKNCEAISSYIVKSDIRKELTEINDDNRRLHELAWMCGIKIDKDVSISLRKQILDYYRERCVTVERIIESCNAFTLSNDVNFESCYAGSFGFRDMNSSLSLKTISIGNLFHIETENYHTRLEHKSEPFIHMRVVIPESVMETVKELPTEPPQKKKKIFSLEFVQFSSEKLYYSILIKVGRVTRVDKNLSNVFFSYVLQIENVDFELQKRIDYGEWEQCDTDFTKGELNNTRSIQMSTGDGCLNSMISEFFAFREHLLKKYA